MSRSVAHSILKKMGVEVSSKLNSNRMLRKMRKQAATAGLPKKLTAEEKAFLAEHKVGSGKKKSASKSAKPAKKSESGRAAKAWPDFLAVLVSKMGQVLSRKDIIKLCCEKYGVSQATVAHYIHDASKGERVGLSDAGVKLEPVPTAYKVVKLK